MSTKRVRKRPVRTDDIYRVRNVRDPRVSPDGKLVAYVQTAVDRESDTEVGTLWLAPTDGAGEPRAFTQGAANAPRWSPDGRLLAFVAKREAGSQIYVAPLDGGEARAITTGEGTPTEPAWSPDGRRIAFVRSVGPRRGKGAVEQNAPRVIRDLYYKSDGFGLFDARRRHVFTVDVETGEMVQVTSGDWHDTQPAWSHDGKSIAFVANRSRKRGSMLFRSDLWIVPSLGGKARRLTRERGTAASPVFSPDGKSIAFVGAEHGDDPAGRPNSLLVVSPGGKREPCSAIKDFDRNVSALGPAGPPLQWAPDGRSLFFLAGDRGAVPVWEVELASGIAKKRVDGDFEAQSLALTPDGRAVVYVSAWTSALPEVRLAPLGRGSARTISRANAALLEEIELGPTERFHYRSADGLEIEAFVVTPPGARKGRRLPTVLEIHGGPHGMHPTTYNAMRTQALAGAGYAVLLPNPRGSSSYGETFERGCVRDWAGGDFADLMAGVDALVERKIADPDRLFVSGYSYGGYMSSWAVGQTDRFRAAAIGAPVIDLVSSLGTDDIAHYNISSMGGTPEACFDEYRNRSPLTHVDKVKTPCLLLHWEGDLRCPIGQAEQFYTGLKLHGCRAEFIRYPGGSHGVRSPSQNVDYAEREMAWFAKYDQKRR